MNRQIQALKAEFQKNRHSSITWITFLAFSIAPLMGSAFMLIIKNPDLIARSSMLQTKATMLSFSANWASYLSLLTQSVGVGGILLFGFVASWIFGQEYAESTAKDLLALPTSRAKIIHAKFICYFIWCLALALNNLLLGIIIGKFLQLAGWKADILFENIKMYVVTTILTIPLGTPIAFFALYGRGYLAPLGFVAISLVLAQIMAATGMGYYFPWSIPGLYSGAGGEYKMQLEPLSYLILLLVCLMGYLATIIWWKYADQTK